MTTKKEKREQLLKELEALKKMRDVEVAHVTADGLLIKYIGDDEIANAFKEIPRWYA